MLMFLERLRNYFQAAILPAIFLKPEVVRTRREVVLLHLSCPASVLLSVCINRGCAPGVDDPVPARYIHTGPVRAEDKTVYTEVLGVIPDK